MNGLAGNKILPFYYNYMDLGCGCSAIFFVYNEIFYIWSKSQPFTHEFDPRNVRISSLEVKLHYFCENWLLRYTYSIIITNLPTISWLFGYKFLNIKGRT